jgi:hypothetical protein
MVQHVVSAQEARGVELPQGLVDEMVRVARGERTADSLLSDLHRLYGDDVEAD